MWIVVRLNRNRECWHLLPLSKKEEGLGCYGVASFMSFVSFLYVLRMETLVANYQEIKSAYYYILYLWIKSYHPP